MGPSKQNIPLKIEKNGTFITEIEEVKETWKTELNQLYNPHLESVATLDRILRQYLDKVTLNLSKGGFFT